MFDKSLSENREPTRQSLLHCSTFAHPWARTSHMAQATLSTGSRSHLVSPCPEHNRDRLRRSLPQLMTGETVGGASSRRFSKLHTQINQSRRTSMCSIAIYRPSLMPCNTKAIASHIRVLYRDIPSIPGHKKSRAFWARLIEEEVS